MKWEVEPLGEDLYRELESLAKEVGCFLWKVEYKGNILRLVLDKLDGPVGIEQCANMSRMASVVLDAYNYGKGSYTLEVSSPGLDRELETRNDFERFKGRLARIAFVLNGKSYSVQGRLEGVDEVSGDQIFLRTSKKLWTIPISSITKANLEVEF